RVVTGDTKVVGRGECDGVYFATTGIGIKDPSLNLGLDQIRTGDCVLVSGTVGDHGAAVMLARQEYGLSGDLVSDSASVLPVARSLIRTGGLRFMRDPTRGGLATVVNDIARHTGLGVCLHEDSIPVCDQVNAVCEVLGLDPYYLASEGRIVAVIDPEAVPDALGGLSTLAPDARVIGTIEKGSGSVVIRTRFGGERILDELEEDLLPRIC
ncbi:MAG: AIR synthase-related protein, partial [Gammaproteobacteria bacterium]|nr:AIR synthase-related protein [Gammaproteobacteria bacterium]